LRFCIEKKKTVTVFATLNEQEFLQCDAVQLFFGERPTLKRIRRGALCGTGDPIMVYVYTRRCDVIFISPYLWWVSQIYHNDETWLLYLEKYDSVQYSFNDKIDDWTLMMIKK